MKDELAHSEVPAARRWMVVDDNEEVLAIMAATLAAIGNAQAVCFNSPAQALQAFAADPRAFQLVITDFEMPGMNGIELGRRIRKISPAQKLVLATGSNIFTEAEALYNGFRTVVAKPFSLTSLECGLRIAGVLETEKLCAA